MYGKVKNFEKLLDREDDASHEGRPTEDLSCSAEALAGQTNPLPSLSQTRREEGLVCPRN